MFRVVLYNSYAKDFQKIDKKRHTGNGCHQKSAFASNILFELLLRQMIKKIFAGKKGKVQGPKMLTKGKNRERERNYESAG